MKLLFDWLLRKFKKENDIINPFRKFKVYNAEAYVTKTKYIPEVVVEGLQSNLMELPEPVKKCLDDYDAYGYAYFRLFGIRRGLFVL